MTLGDGASKGRIGSPPPAVGATLIAASAVVLVVGVAWLNRGDHPPTDRVAPTADGVTQPTDADGDEVDIPPSQPAVAVSFGPGGEILRPDPVRARIIDESGAEVLVPLPPNTTVDTVTGAIVPVSPGTTGSGGTSAGPTSPGTTRPGGTSPTPSSPPTTPSPTTTDPPTTTTDPPTTTTSEPPTTTTTTVPTDPPPDPTDPGSLLDALIP